MHNAEQDVHCIFSTISDVLILIAGTSLVLLRHYLHVSPLQKISAVLKHKRFGGKFSHVYPKPQFRICKELLSGVMQRRLRLGQGLSEECLPRHLLARDSGARERRSPSPCDGGLKKFWQLMFPLFFSLLFGELLIWRVLWILIKFNFISL